MEYKSKACLIKYSYSKNECLSDKIVKLMTNLSKLIKYKKFSFLDECIIEMEAEMTVKSKYCQIYLVKS